MILTIIAFFGMLAVLILAHEFGHLVTAKAAKVKVLEFGLGFPPRLFRIKRGGTIYSLNAVPLGGFTKMAGEEDPTEEGSLASKSAGIRLLVLSAGSIMNLLLPLLLFSIAFMIPHDLIMEPTVIAKVAPNSPAEMANMQPGDTILTINGKTVSNISDLHRYIQLNLGKEVPIVLERGTGTRTVYLKPRWQPPEGEGAIGIEYDLEAALAGQTAVPKSEPFWRAIPLGVGECIEAFVLFKNEIIKWIIGAVTPAVVGPVGIAQLTGEVARIGLSPLMELAAFISINLGIINLLPIPALDGGRIAFVFIELIRRGRRIPPKTEGMIHLVGFALLIALILAVTFQDIQNIISGNGVIP